MRSLLTGKLLQRAEDMLHLLSHSLKDAETPEAQSTGSQVAAFSETATALAFFFFTITQTIMHAPGHGMHNFKRNKTTGNQEGRNRKDNKEG